MGVIRPIFYMQIKRQCIPFTTHTNFSLWENMRKTVTHYSVKKRKKKSAISLATTCRRYGYSLANAIPRPPLNELAWTYWKERAEEGGFSYNSGVNTPPTPVESLLMTLVLSPPTAKHFIEMSNVPEGENKANKLIN